MNQLRHKLSGEGITPMDFIAQWTTEDKLETSYKINSTDMARDVDISSLENVRWIMFSSDAKFKISLTAGAQTIEFEVEGLFSLNPSSTFLGTVTQIQVSTDSVDDITVDIRVYGGTVS